MPKINYCSKLLLVVINCFYFISYSEAQRGTQCQTPNGDTAICVSIYQCNSFLSAIHNRLSSKYNYIKKSQCGYDKNPLVCCGSLPRDSPEAYTYPSLQRQNFNLNKNNISLRSAQHNKKCHLKNTAIPGRSSCGFQQSDLGTSDLILGGDQTEIDEFPWMVLLGYITNTRHMKWACGGSLINSRYILTAGHCVTGNKLTTEIGILFKVKLGEHNTATKIDCDFERNCRNTQPLIIGIEKVILHPNYKSVGKTNYNDIALIRLEQPVKFSDYIRPICLANPTDDLNEKDYLFSAGWGRAEKQEPSPVKLKVELPFIRNDKCSRIFALYGIKLINSQFCAGGEDGRDSCSGDSGGPLMKRSSSKKLQWLQYGIVSFGPVSCGIKGVPGVYTKVSDYIPWIHSVVKD